MCYRISNEIGRNQGQVSIAYKSGKNRGRFFEKLVIALLDQVVVLSQINGLVGRGITLVGSLSVTIEVNLPGC